MNILDICQEAVNKGFISPDLAQKLNHLLWHHQLNTVELATLEFLSKRIEAGKVIVAPQAFCHGQTILQRVD